MTGQKPAAACPGKLLGGAVVALGARWPGSGI